MIYIAGIILALLSIIFYPYVDIVLFTIIVGILINKDSRYFIIAYISSLAIDLVWGRILGLALIVYILYTYLSLYLYTKYPVLRDYGLVILTGIYTLSYVIFYFLFSFRFFSWKNAILWILLHLFIAFIILVTISFIQNYKKKKLFLSTKRAKL